VTTPTALIGLAHGSRHPGVRGPIEALMTAAGELLGVPARWAYLDLTDPDLDTVAGELGRQGSDRAAVVPLLFTNAFHARIDVPATVAEVAASAPLQLVTAGILGTGDDVADVVLTAAQDAGIDDDLPALLYAVGSSDPAANAAVHELAGRLAARRGAPVRAAFGTTEPRAQPVLDELAGAATGRTRRVGIIPLFVSPGLLLDPIAQLAGDRGWPMALPLGRRLAPIVAARYADAV
jgi:sirohydrochlorin ferrochelatase